MNFTLDDVRSDIRAIEGDRVHFPPFDKEDEKALLFRVRYSHLYGSPCFRGLSARDLRTRIYVFLTKFAIPRVDQAIEKLKTPAWAHLYLSDNELHDRPSHNFFTYQGPLVRDEDGDPKMIEMFKDSSKSYLVIFSDPMLGVSVGSIRTPSVYKNENIS